MPSFPAWAPLRRRALAVGVALLLTGCASAPRDGPSAKLALVIGNAAYENAPALSNPVNDATDMCTSLRKLGFKTLCHTNVRGRAEFDALVKDYVEQLGPNTVGVFFYSGHGVQVANANYLIPTQVQPKSVSEDPLRVLYGIDDLFDRLRQQPTKFQLVILDACRTDLFAPAPRPAAGRGTNAVARSGLIRSLETTGLASAGLARITDAPRGTVVLYATASREAAFDGEGRNGPLTKYVLQNIGTPGLPIQTFFQRVTQGVETETARAYGKRQTPYIYGSFSGEFCFAGCREAGVPPVN